MSRHDDLIRLRHMRDHAAEAVAMAAKRAQGDLAADRMFLLALTRLIEIVGEAATKVSVSTQETIRNIPWLEVIGMRNRIVHGYDRVHLGILWNTIIEDFPPLIAALEAAIARMESERK